MASKPENSDDESFIILGTSPGTSLDIKCNGIANGVPNGSLDKAQIEDALKELSVEASMALKANFKLGESPSPASLMAASTIVTEDQTTEELQKRFGEILDENIVLKETLKQNNDSMKEQFMLIASCQEDMLKTHTMHKEKFEETRELVERLRTENKKLKQDLTILAEAAAQAPVNGETGEAKSGPSSKYGPPSALEFVTSPEDDTVDKLTAQLELVEKQRRQVITDNEKLIWQKESLEHIVDATTKERDDYKEKLKDAELKLSNKCLEVELQMTSLKHENEQLQQKLIAKESQNPSPEITQHRNAIIRQLEERVAYLGGELQKAQLRIMELENVKMEYSKYKSDQADILRVQREHLQEMNARLKEATTVVFQPARLSLGAEGTAELGSFTAQVKLYDRTLKHLGELLNKLSQGLADSLVEALGVILSLHELKADRVSIPDFKAGMAAVKQQLETQQFDALANIGQVRGTLSIFEGIFTEYKEAMQKAMAKQELVRPSQNVEALTAALVARGQELQSLEAEVAKLRGQQEDAELMKAQLELYKSDFEAERQSREKMASEKDNVMTDLRKVKKRNEELEQQLEEVRRINPSVYKTATAKRPPAQPATPRRPAASATAPSATTGNMVYTCPKCMRFSCEQYKAMEDHFDFCLDDF